LPPKQSVTLTDIITVRSPLYLGDSRHVLPLVLLTKPTATPTPLDNYTATMGGNTETQDELDQQIEIFKVKKLIKNLEAAKGNGTSMISLILPPGSQISQANKMLSDEYGTASNIKSRVNRLSVLGAITSAQQRLKLYNKCPKVRE
jgi:hypothetical protein